MLFFDISKQLPPLKHAYTKSLYSFADGLKYKIKVVHLLIHAEMHDSQGFINTI